MKTSASDVSALRANYIAIIRPLVDSVVLAELRFDSTRGSDVNDELYRLLLGGLR
ncbi:MAG: hypothetical protein JWL72_3355 [Ilumatobacteraceae bacterium]|nr:hypothetical protein [Ilumatobacteraceae bacterium]MCU1390017.1 hypothetical protein [Ilumatobacteraceae bacterium]